MPDNVKAIWGQIIIGCLFKDEASVNVFTNFISQKKFINYIELIYNENIQPTAQQGIPFNVCILTVLNDKKHITRREIGPEVICEMQKLAFINKNCFVDIAISTEGIDEEVVSLCINRLANAIPLLRLLLPKIKGQTDIYPHISIINAQDFKGNRQQCYVDLSQLNNNLLFLRAHSGTLNYNKITCWYQLITFIMYNKRKKDNGCFFDPWKFTSFYTTLPNYLKKYLFSRFEANNTLKEPINADE